MIPIQFKVAIAAALLAGAFFFGVEWNDRGWKAKEAQLLKDAEEQRLKDAQEASELIAQYVDSEPEVVHDTKIIYRRFGDGLVCSDNERRMLSKTWNTISTGQALGTDGEMQSE